MFKLVRPVLSSIMLVILASAFFLFPVKTFAQTSQEVFPVRRNSVFLLDVSTSMDGRVDLAKLIALGNPPHRKHDRYADWFYVEDRDVIDDAITAVINEIDKFVYGSITLIVFQGARFAEVGNFPVTRLDIDIASRTDPKKERFRRFLLGGEDPGDPKLWGKDWKGVKAAVNGMKKGTGTAICTAMEEACEILIDCLREVEKVSLYQMPPWGYSQDIILVTDGEDNQGPPGCFTRIARKMDQLYQELGPKFLVKRLYWGVECPQDRIAEVLSEEYYRCVPLKGNSFRVLLSDLALAPPYNPALDPFCDFSEFYIDLTSEHFKETIPCGVIKLTPGGDFMLQVYGTELGRPSDGSKLLREEPLRENGVRVDVSSLLEPTDRCLKLELLEGPVAPGKHSVPFRLWIDGEALRRMYDRLIEDLHSQYADQEVQIQRAQVVGGFFLEHVLQEEVSEGPQFIVDFQRDWIPVWFPFLPPEVSVSVVRDPVAAHQAIITFTQNEATRTLARAREGSVCLKISYDLTNGTVEGLESEGRTCLPENVDRKEHTFAIARDEGNRSARVVRLAVTTPEIGIDLRGDLHPELNVYDISVTKALFEIDTWKKVHESSVSSDPRAGLMTVRLSCPLNVNAGFEGELEVKLVSYAGLPTGVYGQIPEGEDRVSCPVDQNRIQRIPLEVIYEDYEALSRLNDSEKELALEFLPSIDDPMVYATLPPAPVLIDLVYKEQRIVVEAEQTAVGPVTPGTEVATVTVKCSSGTAKENRKVNLFVDPDLFLLQDLTGRTGAYTITASEKGTTYRILLSRNVWDDPVKAGKHRAELQITPLNLENIIYEGPTEEERRLDIEIAEPPPPPSRVAYAFFILTILFLGLLVSWIIAILVYAYLIAVQGLQETIYRLWEDYRWIVFVGAGFLGLLLLFGVLYAVFA